MLTSQPPQQGGNFGKSVSVDAMIAVGAPYETAGPNASAGNAYTFDTVTSTFIKKLTSPNPETNGNFGSSVSTLGNLVVVGAPNETVGGHAAAGRAYVFNGQTGALLATLASPAPQPQGIFGWNCSLNQSGLIAVGAPHETVAGMMWAGRAYTFLNGVLKSSFASPNPVAPGSFGSTVIAGDNAIFVCAPQETPGALTGAGQVYVYNPVTAALQTTLVSPAPQQFGFFGCSLAVHQNLWVVGEFGQNQGGLPSVGRVHLYSNGSFMKTLQDPAATAWAAFGFSVVAGAWPGHPLVVGACTCPSDTLGGMGPGSMWVFNAPGFVPFRKKTTGSPNPDMFGYASAIGHNKIVIGNPTETVGNLLTAGRVYVFED